jgi:uncharacterized protein YjbJ (UPF0337 family)
MYQSEVKMGLQERAKATAKNLEGKAQDALGEATGSQKDQLQGKAKQIEANAELAEEDLKDAAKSVIDKA